MTVREVENDSIYECSRCGWEGKSDKLDQIDSYTKDDVEGITGMSFETLPEPFHQCPSCGLARPGCKS